MWVVVEVVDDVGVVVEVVVVDVDLVLVLAVVVFVVLSDVDTDLLTWLFVWTEIFCGITNVIPDLKMDAFLCDISISIFVSFDAKVELIPSNPVRSNSPDVVSAAVGIAFVGTLSSSFKPNELFTRKPCVVWSSKNVISVVRLSSISDKVLVSEFVNFVSGTKEGFSSRLNSL